MPTSSSEKCRQCSKLLAQQAQQKHIDLGDCCWVGELCHKRRTYYKERDLYTGDIELKQAIQAVGQGRWQDVLPDLGSSAFA